MADTTWGTPNDRYAMTLTHAHGLACLRVKSLRAITASSAEAEGIASSKAGEAAQELAEIKRATGNPQEGPIVIGTDSITNGQVARRQGAANRLKHALRRWETLLERVDSGLVKLVHVPDD